MGDPKVVLKGITKSEDGCKIKLEVGVDNFKKATEIAEDLEGKLQKYLTGQTTLD